MAMIIAFVALLALLTKQRRLFLYQQQPLAKCPGKQKPYPVVLSSSLGVCFRIQVLIK